MSKREYPVMIGVSKNTTNHPTLHPGRANKKLYTIPYPSFTEASLFITHPLPENSYWDRVSSPTLPLCGDNTYLPYPTLPYDQSLCCVPFYEVPHPPGSYRRVLSFFPPPALGHEIAICVERVSKMKQRKEGDEERETGYGQEDHPNESCHTLRNICLNGSSSRNAIFPWGERAEASFDSSHSRPITELCLEGS
eukprot:264386-Hanusia_phi.AAC.1